MQDEEQHLGIPVIGAERPAVMEDYGLSLAPVLVKDFHAVFRLTKLMCHSSINNSNFRWISWESDAASAALSTYTHPQYTGLVKKGRVDHKLLRLAS
jgi:hypothetical protein